ncbi:hypothetical protein [Luteolibacter soli]|uniref:Uncharacterized protein n=1 Tax=Luteolibacter soli TaxID=3135280 RepID=A0ABU9APE3_9BACT
MTDEMVAQAADILAAEGAEEDGIGARVLDLAGDELLAKRLREWIREVFGRVMLLDAGHRIHFLDTFSVYTSDRKPVRIPNHAEPIVEIATRLAQDHLRRGRKEYVYRIAEGSAPVRSALPAIEQGVSLDGAVSASAFNGIPAEAYPDYPKSFWKRLLGR